MIPPNVNLTVVSEAYVRAAALRDLIIQYVMPNTFLGFRSLGASPDVMLPVIFVSPRGEKAQMVSTAKFRLDFSVAIYWFVRDNKIEDVIKSATFIGEALVKLLSNNATGDLGNAVPSNKFKTYPNPAGGYYWLDSEFSDIRWSVPYLNPKPDTNAGRYEMAGRIAFSFYDEILK